MLKTLGVAIAGLAFVLPATAEAVASEAIVTTWKPYNGAKIAFDVLRKGKPFGTHIVSFEEAADGQLKVTTDVDLKVKVGPFTAFQYRLDSVETWQDGVLVALNGRTNDNGDASAVRAARNGANLLVKGSAYQGSAPLDIVPSSHWNIEQVRSSEMLSTEDGSVLDMTVQPKGRETLSINGQTVDANRYLLDSDIDIDLWYDDEGRWLKLAFEARNEKIEYRLSELY